MKPFEEQNFYELFDIPPDSRPEEIKRAYELARVTYGGDSLATYSLFNEQEKKEILRRVSLAYETLSEPKRRRLYDLDIEVLKDSEKPSGKTAPMADLFSSPGSAPVQKTIFCEKPDLAEINGARLRVYRESLQIPLQEIADKTRINITYFEFLEKERYTSLPPPVYLRGYVQQYARFLGLDPNGVADRILFLVKAEDLAGEGGGS